MKILYALQGTGNGHISRAQEIIPILQQKAEVEVLLSGTQAHLEPGFPVTYRLRGLSYVIGKNGGIDIIQTYRKAQLRMLLKEMRSVPLQQYDLVINDFEPVSAWACKLFNLPCISLSHQAAVLNRQSPKPKHIDPVGNAILKVYAPADISYGFHFKPYDEKIFTPVIRKAVREVAVGKKGHYTVYLPAYADKKIISILRQFPEIKWEVFSKNISQPSHTHHIDLFPIHGEMFIKSMAASEGVICGAGFETPAEALFLQKKLLVIPMKKQYEQHCNAAALKDMGVPVIKSLKEKHIGKLRSWLQSDTRISVDYPDQTEDVLTTILAHFQQVRPALAAAEQSLRIIAPEEISAKQFRKIILKKVLSRLG